MTTIDISGISGCINDDEIRILEFIFNQLGFTSSKFEVQERPLLTDCVTSIILQGSLSSGKGDDFWNEIFPLFVPLFTKLALLIFMALVFYFIWSIIPTVD